MKKEKFKGSQQEMPERFANGQDLFLFSANRVEKILIFGFRNVR